MAHCCRAKAFIKLHRSGVAEMQSGRLDEAFAKLEQALAEVRKIGLEGYQVKIINNLGIVCELKGDTEQARDRYLAAYSMARRKLGERAALSRVVGQNLDRVSRAAVAG